MTAAFSCTREKKSFACKQGSLGSLAMASEIDPLKSPPPATPNPPIKEVQDQTLKEPVGEHKILGPSESQSVKDRTKSSGEKEFLFRDSLRAPS